MRVIQTGKAQNYLLVALVTVSVSAGRILVAAEVMSDGTATLSCTEVELLIAHLSLSVPLLGALLTLLPWGKWFKLDQGREERLIKSGAIAISLLPLGLAIVLWFGYNKAIGGMQYQIDVPWIPLLNINYHMGVDGLSVPLVFLTTLLTTLGLYYSSHVIKERVREFFFLFLLLEMGMLGRLRLARSGAVLRLLGGRPGADVLPDRHLGPGERPAAVLGHQVLPLHAGRLGVHAAGDHRHLLHYRHV